MLHVKLKCENVPQWSDVPTFPPEEPVLQGGEVGLPDEDGSPGHTHHRRLPAQPIG